VSRSYEQRSFLSLCRGIDFGKAMERFELS
jgi:hypothetical protein